MPSPHETAYPRLKTSVSGKDLEEVYTPTETEVALANKIAKGAKAKVCFLILLKTGFRQ